MKKVYKLIILMILLVVVIFNEDAYSQESYHAKMMEACSLFVDSYKPTYVVNSDTLFVSRFTLPPDSVNIFLFDCIKRKDLSPLKFAAVIFIKQNREYRNVNKQDFFLGDGDYSNNGFVELVRYAMGIKDEAMDFYNFPYYTGEVCKWIRENRNKIEDYCYVDKF